MANIVPFSAEYDTYLRDESRMVGHADSISFPESEEEIRDILRRLSGQHTAVTVQGGRTGLAAGAVPFGGHVMNLSRMNRLLDVRYVGGVQNSENGKTDGEQGADGQCSGGENKGTDRYEFTVQPGMVLSSFRKIISARQIAPEQMRSGPEDALRFINDREYFFPTDPTETSACLGGMTACNASGARSFRFGAARKHITGLRMVLADGRIVQLRRGTVFASGRKLALPMTDGSVLAVDLPTYKMPACKNASGYYVAENMDAIDLLIGSDGTLGVISEITVELIPLPQQIWGVSCFMPNEAAAIRFTESLRRQFGNLAAIEYFDSHSLDILRSQKRKSTAFSALPEVPENWRCCIYTEIHADNEAEAEETLLAIGTLLELCGGHEADTWVARTDTDREIQQFFRHALPESVNMLIDERKKKDPVITKLAADMSVPDDCLAEVMSIYRSSLEENDLQAAIYGHMGNNHLHVNILPRDGEDYRRGKALYAVWAAKITAMGGAVSAEHGVGKLKRDFLKVMYGPEHIREMTALKRAFDPAGIFGIGNLFAPEEQAGDENSADSEPVKPSKEG
ncbi:MAG: FAD-binding oxidoreductase [Lachnospiraceae bacterium]|nr:FAD-binding oxidoreductase [Lachnospiraceae bacterium]